MITKQISALITVFIIALGALAQDNSYEFNCGDVITDARDGQIYSTVLIGDQCWMAANLNTGRIVPDFKQEDNGLIEKTCYDNNPQNCARYGGLYTWHEAMNWTTEGGSQGICPAGWRLPSKADWEELVEFLGPEDAGQHLKVTRDHTPSWDGTNSSGFTALPAGVGYEGYFGRIEKWGLFWSSSQVDENYAWFAQLDNHWYPAPPKYKKLYIGDHFVKENGFSVRCLKSKK
jgi:uncharacterized protein (TIGR02145 family)